VQAGASVDGVVKRQFSGIPSLPGSARLRSINLLELGKVSSAKKKQCECTKGLPWVIMISRAHHQPISEAALSRDEGHDDHT